MRNFNFRSRFHFSAVVQKTEDATADMVADRILTKPRNQQLFPQLVDLCQLPVTRYALPVTSVSPAPPSQLLLASAASQIP